MTKINLPIPCGSNGFSVALDLSQHSFVNLGLYSVRLVTNEKLEAFNKALLRPAHLWDLILGPL